MTSEPSQTDIEFLVGAFQDHVPTEAQALEVLRKYGNAANAIEAIMGGKLSVNVDDNDNEPPPLAYPSHHPSPTAGASSNTIDLTMDDDDEIGRALRMSLEEHTSESTRFGKSERDPDSKWAIVRTTTTSTTVEDDPALQQAMEASLEDLQMQETRLHYNQAARQDGRPIAVRHQSWNLTYGGLVLQALFSVPQVRECVSKLTIKNMDPEIPRDSPDYAAWNLSQLFANLDLAQICTLTDEYTLPSLKADPLVTTERLGHVSADLVKNVATLLPELTESQTLDKINEHLMNFVVAGVDIQDQGQSRPTLTCVVLVDVGDDYISANRQKTPNELVARVSAGLVHEQLGRTTVHTIVEPSTVITFQLNHVSSSSELFVYPKTIYLDRFMIWNFEIVQRKREVQNNLIAEAEKLHQRKKVLTEYDNGNSVKNIEASIHYYENLAHDNGSSQRRATLDRVLGKLKTIFSKLKDELESINSRLSEIEAETKTLFECPELQNHPYELRAVLVSSGIPGSSNMHSYVQDKGKWWKTVVDTVTEVPEATVLTDNTGLHLKAGPYLLVYSRRIPPEKESSKPLPWPKVFLDELEANNKAFLDRLRVLGS